MNVQFSNTKVPIHFFTTEVLTSNQCPVGLRASAWLPRLSPEALQAFRGACQLSHFIDDYHDYLFLIPPGHI